ncbi:MAG: histidine--tRNA ligase [Nitrospira sp.]|nr:histidine--tRNA ligase [Nitrospira sp.]
MHVREFRRRSGKSVCPCGLIESLGTSDPRADVEVIALLWRILSDLNLPALTLEINNLGYTADRDSYRPLLVAYLTRDRERLCGNCQRRVETNPLRVLDCKVPECRAATEAAPRLADSLSENARAYFAAVLAGLDAIGIPYRLNHRLVRGLDYYCLTTFEVTSTSLGAQNAVGAGGRYDGLIETLGGPPTPAVGFALGLERMAMMLSETAPVSLPGSTTVYIAGFGNQGSATGLSALEELRLAGIRAISDFRAGTLKSHLRQADRSGSRFTLIIGDDEVAKGTGILRDMTTKAQHDVPLTSLSRDISSLLRAS